MWHKEHLMLSPVHQTPVFCASHVAKTTKLAIVLINVFTLNSHKTGTVELIFLLLVPGAGIH